MSNSLDAGAPENGGLEACALNTGRAKIALVLESGREQDNLEHALAARAWRCERFDELAACAAHDVAIVDNRFADTAAVRAFLAAPARPAVILLANFGTVRDALEAVRAGACDYLSRPLSLEQVVFAVERALAQRALQRENFVLRRSLEGRVELGALSSKDERMRRVAEVVGSIADTRASVLIQGESGVGKSALARAIHARSSRAPKPFVVVDCGAIPATLLESTLFGHVRGAFTGANRDKPGLIEAADGGTLFLDEIGNAALDLQARLLRVVQERVFERVGEARTRSVDVRWIAATHRNLESEARAGRFREDLYWRLNVVSIELPALRERPGDIPLLAQTFLERYAAEHRRNVHGISPRALATLTAYRWPGNVRELEHTLERAVLLARGTELTPDDLGPALADSAPRAAAPAVAGAVDLKAALEAPERRLIEEALAACGGRRQEAARRLGINRSTLFNKMRRHGLTDFPRPARSAAEAHHPA
jgi:two-component system response regulator AtoC